MAAVQTPHAAGSLNSPTSSHGIMNDDWDFAISADQYPSEELKYHDDDLDPIDTREPLSARSNGSVKSNYAMDQAYRASARANNSLNNRGSNTSGDGQLVAAGAQDDYPSMHHRDQTEDGTDNPQKLTLDQSKWIHRDKLARIENAELQAAGIVLPRNRASSKASRRDRDMSRERVNAFNRSEQSLSRRRMESETRDEGEREIGEQRSPDEQSFDYSARRPSAGSRSMSVSRIPVARPGQTAIPRRKNSGDDDNAGGYSRSRSRSNSINMLDDNPPLAPPAPINAPGASPRKRINSDATAAKKTAPAGARKTSAAAGPRSAPNQRPKTRSGKDATPARPTTRSGELNSIKTPEGDPPWMESMYKPDPRLPPDQQLLPTVAKRLQQEQWEREGKFGTAYDKDFRPLNDNAFLPRPEPKPESEPEPEPEVHVPAPEETVQEKRPEENPQWPLPGNQLSINTGRPGTATGNSYSTMPKIQGKPQGVALPSPLPVRVQEPDEDKEKKGCLCCVVM